MQQYLIPPEIYGDTPDHLLAYFAHFAQQPWAILLDSAAPHHVNSRFDIMVAEPLATLEAKSGISVLTDEHGAHRYHEDPFTVLKCALKRYFPQQVSSDLPFVGGALGYFAYDLGRYVEKLPATATADIQLPDMAVGIYPWALILDKQHKQLWYVDYHGAAEAGWLKLHARLQHALAQSAAFSLSGSWQANMDKAGYVARFNQVQDYLLSGDCYQINLTQRFSAPYQGDEWQAYLQLRDKNAAPFSAFIRLPQGAVLSISPERFLQLHCGNVETKPIKGTRPRGICPMTDAVEADNLRNSAKDRAENVMIVDLLRNDLGKVCLPGSVAVPQLFAIESFPAVHHLVSTVTGTLAPEYNACDLLRGAFPGGSITGAPKVRAMQIIEQLEPQRRSVYCGAIGYINSNGDMDTNIAIRTLICSEGQIHCQAGGGIVADSEVNSEYQETLDKVNKILPVLAAKEH
ncbi:MAG: aminodeoxychorismate synthase component I [Gammaproteobacteria bacterium]|nr:aminodeoxychorismate synthase component I [Gammaproteobacteria bacterium]MBU1555154.1 aminodeoxychorismate synthase component I [Gammaproteobacteria bacterium]MBU2070252.1 aminodeoxychorismate synthase component I [Gammaproteobacteria bacterium]MBU2183955.1 aminodeoxychorismate synthase component I [Gammaproteobacteria bacterium]MBU2206759.1 aminodeoxychorismate synthase component I [Gammaproteobacteria bacterium]